MSKNTVKQTAQVITKIPMTPNFIEVNGHMWPITELSDEQLARIGECWTKDLIDKARKRRLNG